MIHKARSLSDLPNTENYKFYGIEKDGTVRECIVNKDEKGLHRVTGAKFADLIAWLPLNYLQNPDYFTPQTTKTPYLLNL